MMERHGSDKNSRTNKKYHTIYTFTESNMANKYNNK